MPIDYETVRANNIARAEEQKAREAVEGIKLGNPALADDEAAWLHHRRQEEAERREQTLHQAELAAFHKWTSDRIQEQSKPGHGDPRNVAELDRVRTEVCVFGRWPAESWILKADPAATLPFQSLRSRLAPSPEDFPRTVRVDNPMFIWKD